MKFINELLKKLEKWIIEAQRDPGKHIPPWDLTSEKPTDIWIETTARILIKLLELKAIYEGEDLVARSDSSATGAICRARYQNKNVKVVIVTDNEVHSKEEVVLTNLIPITNNNWRKPYPPYYCPEEE